jgi:hypothetical protein
VYTSKFTGHISPFEKFSKRKLDKKIDLRIPFGAYAQIVEPVMSNDNSPRTTGAIALRPTHNLQGSYCFYSLKSRTFVIRDKWTQLPIPRDVVDMLNNMASSDKIKVTADPIWKVGTTVVGDLDPEPEPPLPRAVPGPPTALVMPPAQALQPMRVTRAAALAPIQPDNSASDMSDSGIRGGGIVSSVVDNIDTDVDNVANNAHTASVLPVQNPINTRSNPGVNANTNRSIGDGAKSGTVKDSKAGGEKTKRGGEAFRLASYSDFKLLSLPVYASDNTSDVEPYIVSDFNLIAISEKKAHEKYGVSAVEAAEK